MDKLSELELAFQTKEHDVYWALLQVASLSEMLFIDAFDNELIMPKLRDAVLAWRSAVQAKDDVYAALSGYKAYLRDSKKR